MAQLGPRWHWTSPRALLAGRDPCNRYLAPGLQPQLLGRDVQGLVRSGSSISICPYVSVSITANPYQTNPKHSIQYSNPDIHSNLFTPFCLYTVVISVCLDFVHGDQLRQRTVWCQHQIRLRHLRKVYSAHVTLHATWIVAKSTASAYFD